MNIIACACIDPYDGMMVNGYVNIYILAVIIKITKRFSICKGVTTNALLGREYVRLFMERDFHTTSAMICGIIFSCVIILLAGDSKIMLSPLHMM